MCVCVSDLYSPICDLYWLFCNVHTFNLHKHTNFIIGDCLIGRGQSRVLVIYLYSCTMWAELSCSDWTPQRRIHVFPIMWILTLNWESAHHAYRAKTEMNNNVFRIAMYKKLITRYIFQIFAQGIVIWEKT